jgi:hypothetical protein
MKAVETFIEDGITTVRSPSLLIFLIISPISSISPGNGEAHISIDVEDSECGISLERINQRVCEEDSVQSKGLAIDG